MTAAAVLASDVEARAADYLGQLHRELAEVLEQELDEGVPRKRLLLTERRQRLERTIPSLHALHQQRLNAAKRLHPVVDLERCERVALRSLKGQLSAVEASPLPSAWHERDERTARIQVLTDAVAAIKKGARLDGTGVPEASSTLGKALLAAGVTNLSLWRPLVPLADDVKERTAELAGLDARLEEMMGAAR